MKSLLAAPQKTLLWWILFLLAGMLIAFAFDRSMFDWLSRFNKRSAFSDVMRFPEFIGNYQVHLLILPIMFAAANRQRLFAGYLLAFACGNIVSLIKYSVGRARPQMRLGAWHFEPLIFRDGSNMNSFPSGDASAAMILCGLLGLFFPRGRHFFLFLGLWCALGRAAVRRHFLSDVLAGAAIGLACVLLSARIFGPETLKFKSTDSH